MEKEEIIQQFETIEKKVDTLYRSFKALEAENRELKNTIMNLESDLQVKKEAENTYNEVRGQIRERIDSLLSRLEDVTEEQFPNT